MYLLYIKLTCRIFICFRTFIFPFLIQGGKPTPLFPFVAAFIFCLLNGYVQAGHLLKYADLQKTVSQVQFYTGTKLQTEFVTNVNMFDKYRINLQLIHSELITVTAILK